MTGAETRTPRATATTASQKPLRIKCYAGTLKRGLSSTVTPALGSRWRSALTRVTHQGGSMISVSDCQLRIVAATADLLPVEARGTFLQRVTAELRGRRDSATATSNRRCARRCSISQRHDLLENKAAGTRRQLISRREQPVDRPVRCAPIRKQRGNAKPAENWNGSQKRSHPRCSWHCDHGTSL
jgi:hypothetical protein